MNSTEDKKVFMLLKSVIFHYHGLDEAEKGELEKTSMDLNAHAEYQWALEFISQDYITAFDRARAIDGLGLGEPDKVLVDEAPVRARRLRLCARTLLVLETGLTLLGLRTLTRM